MMMMMMRTKRIAFLPLFAAASLVSATTAQPVNAGKSQITATFTQMNVPVDGSFKTFKGSVSYDPANPAASSAELSINTASFDLGDEEYNAEVRKKEWFDSTAFPTATFKSTAVRALGPDRFEATGTLSLKGRVQTVKAPVTVKSTGGVRSYTGELPISRATFAMGDPSWNEVLEDRVLVKFIIVTPAS
jgi:polyisoprenoid-binding protein YceI